jgi:polysaccharide pyruvyl transferase WcaK-like protein
VRWLPSSGNSAGGSRPIPAPCRRPRVFTSSWGQLESGGSNIGDLAIFSAQVRQLGGEFELGVLSADPAATAERFGVRGFSLSCGRAAAFFRGVLWADAVIVGGGELVQDRSSLLYTPFNLLPLRFAWWLRKPSFVWGAGIGQGAELAPWTPGQLRRWMGRSRGVTVRDRPSREVLLDQGLNPARVVHTADSAFALTDLYEPGPRMTDVLGAAPRDVSNRRGSLLPLEIRRKLGIAGRPGRDPDPGQWAKVLDRHLGAHGGRVRMFAFHTGPLSSSDDSSCARVASLMENSSRVDLVGVTDLESFMGALSGCRTILTAPLHGAILGVIAGSLPVAVPYSSKNSRFMSEAGLGDLVVKKEEGDWSEDASARLDRAWVEASGIWEGLRDRRLEMAAKSALNPVLFKRMALGQI